METTDLINALNAYRGENPWQDVILPSGIHQEAASEQLDPGGASDRFITSSGRVIAWDGSAGRWHDAGIYEGDVTDDAARWTP